MSESHACPQEPLILVETVFSLSEALTLHVRHCASCQEARVLAAQMRQLVAPCTAQPPAADVIWLIAQLSKPRTPWTLEVGKGVVVLAASALAAAWSWPTIVGYVSRVVPESAMLAVPFLSSCVVAAALAAVAATTMRRLTGE